MSVVSVTEHLEIRKLPVNELIYLSGLLDHCDFWKQLMIKIPSTLNRVNFKCDISDDNEAKYRSEDVKVISNHARKTGKSCSSILFDEWGTSGRVRPTLGHLLHLLKRAQLYRAADYVSEELLSQGKATRPIQGPAATVPHSLADSYVLSIPTYDIETPNGSQRNNPFPPLESLFTIGNKSGSKSSILSKIRFPRSGTKNKAQTAVLKKTSADISVTTTLPHFTYEQMQAATTSFDKTRLLGVGGFGEVFLATGLRKESVAVKRLFFELPREKVIKQFRNEVEILCKYKHENLLMLLGYSCDGPFYCLVYEYLSGGTLRDRLGQAENALPWTDRFYIALGIAKGVKYLHTAYPRPLIHRDIKPDNILLDSENNPKLCDFGLIRIPAQNQSVVFTEAVGTAAYMAPEAFSGDISVKSDVYSFGVVLIELLTDLSSTDDVPHAETSVLTFVKDSKSGKITLLLDEKAGNWFANGTNFGEELFRISKRCVKRNRRKRPTMVDTTKMLVNLARSFKSMGEIVRDTVHRFLPENRRKSYTLVEKNETK